MTSFRFHHQTDDRLSVGKIVCLARSYQKHADEMNTSVPREPVLFLKPASAVVFSGEHIVKPKQSTCLHHEVELGVVINKRCKHLEVQDAKDAIFGYVLALDITARDIQSEAKRKGWPWTIAKGFDTFAPFSTMISSSEVNNPDQLEMKLWVNDSLRQQGNTRDLIWPVDYIISYVSSMMTLEPGDVILTGTPEGVSEIKAGDRIRAVLVEKSELCRLEVDVVDES